MNKRPKDNTSPRVNRGGSWHNTDAPNVRAAYRFVNAPTDRYDFLGFRTALRGRETRP